MKYRFRTIKEFKQIADKKDSYGYHKEGNCFSEGMYFLAGREISDSDADKILNAPEDGGFFTLDFEGDEDYTWRYSAWMITPIRKIKGYKLVKEEYRAAMRVIAGGGGFKLKDVEFQHNSPMHRKLEEVGVMELWFEPVYEAEFKIGDWVYVKSKRILSQLDVGDVGQVIEVTANYFRVKVEGKINFSNLHCPTDLRLATKEEIENATIKLPEVNGYKGSDTGTAILYGCAELSYDWFESTATRSIVEFKLTSGVTVKREEVDAIRKYLKHHGKI